MTPMMIAYYASIGYLAGTCCIKTRQSGILIYFLGMGCFIAIISTGMLLFGDEHESMVWLNVTRAAAYFDLGLLGSVIVLGVRRQQNMSSVTD